MPKRAGIVFLLVFTVFFNSTPGFSRTQNSCENLFFTKKNAILNYINEVKNKPSLLLVVPHSHIKLEDIKNNPTQWIQASIQFMMHPVAELTKSKRRLAFIPYFLLSSSIAVSAAMFREYSFQQNQSELIQTVAQHTEFIDIKLLYDQGQYNFNQEREAVTERLKSLNLLNEQIDEISQKKDTLNSDQTAKLEAVFMKSKIFSPFIKLSKKAFFHNSADLITLNKIYTKYYFKLRLAYSQNQSPEESSKEATKIRIQTVENIIKEFSSSYTAREIFILSGLREGVISESLLDFWDLSKSHDQLIKDLSQRLYTAENPNVELLKIKSFAKFRSSNIDTKKILELPRIKYLLKYQLLSTTDAKILGEYLTQLYSSKTLNEYNEGLDQVENVFSQFQNFPKTLLDYALDSYMQSTQLPKKIFVLDSSKSSEIEIENFDEFFVFASRRFEFAAFFKIEQQLDLITAYQVITKIIDDNNLIRSHFSTKLASEEDMYTFAIKNQLFLKVTENNNIPLELKRKLIASGIATQVYFYHLAEYKPETIDNWQIDYQEKQNIYKTLMSATKAKF